MKRFLDISALLILSFSLTFFIGELAVRLLKPQLTFSKASETASHCYERDVFLPFTLPKNHECSMFTGTKSNITITSNNQGYRGKDFSIQKDSNEYRILVLGDSYTWGWGVEDNKTYPFQLNNLLKNTYKKSIEVINAGYADGFSPDSYYVYLKKRGLKLDPNLVILQFSIINDISDLSETVWEKTDPNGYPEKISSCCRTVDDNTLRYKQIELKYRYPIFRESQLFVFLADILQKNIIKYSDTSFFFDPKRDMHKGCELDPDCIYLFYPEEQKIKKILLEISHILSERHIPFVVFLIPHEAQLYPERFSKYYDFQKPPTDNLTFLQKRLKVFFKENNITYLDAFDSLDSQRQRGDPYFVQDAHFNDLGNEILAEALANYIVENKYIK